MDDLREALLTRGACIVECADLSPVPEDARHGLPRGIAIAVPLVTGIVSRIPGGPSKEYQDEYDRANALLDELSGHAADLLVRRGALAVPQAASHVGIDPATLSTQLPHKTVARLAGVGWIGKCAVLVTPSHGAAIRLASVLTDADLPVGNPATESRCGDCTVCVDVCPGEAVTGTLWEPGMVREKLFDPFACREGMKKRAAAAGSAPEHRRPR